MDKVEIYLNKYKNSKLKAELLETAPFFSELIEKYIVAVCSNLIVTNQFINSLLKTKFNFLKKEKDSPNSNFKELISKDSGIFEKTLNLYYYNEKILYNQMPEGLTDEEITNYKYQVCKNICSFIHELNHCTGIDGFYKLDKTFKPISLSERKKIVDSDSGYVYRKKSGFYIERFSKTKSLKAIVDDLLYEATTEVIAHKLLNLSVFDDIKYINDNGERKDSYNIPWGYEPLSTIILIFSFINPKIFSSYYTNNVTAKVKRTWDEILNVAKNFCLCYNNMKECKDKSGEEYNKLINEAVCEINKIIKYFYEVAKSDKVSEKRGEKIIRELGACLTNKNFWKKIVFWNTNEEIVDNALENLTTLEELGDVTNLKN